MSRIRSVHPSLFTDPEFVQVSMPARMLLIGIWTECDDRGVFEWKPLALKMKLFPADNVDMDALLTELTSADRIRQVEHEGKAYGICRNFAKYQRPKNPAYKYPFTPAWGDYLGVKPDDSGTPTPALPQPSPSTPEIPPQMEDGEEEVEERKELEGAQARSKRGCRLPEDFEPDANGIEFAKGLGLDHAQTLAAFKDHWTAATGQKASKLDWQAAWRTWCRNEVAFSRNKPKPEAVVKFQPQEVRDAQRHMAFAALIQKGISPGVQFSAIDRNQMIAAGMVTIEQCRAAGCAA